MNTYHVLGEHTLGYINGAQPNVFCPLAGKPQKGGLDWKNGPSPIGDQESIRTASLEDFNYFRVSPNGHIIPV